MVMVGMTGINRIRDKYKLKIIKGSTIKIDDFSKVNNIII